MKKLSKILILFTVLCFVSLEIHARKETNLTVESTSHELVIKDKTSNDEYETEARFYSADSRTVYSKKLSYGITFSSSFDDLPVWEYLNAVYYWEYKYSNVEMNYQNINEKMYDLGTKISGFSNQLMFFYQYTTVEFDYSQCVDGLCLMGMPGLGLKNLSLNGNYYNLENPNSTSCKDFVKKEDITSI